MTNTEIVNVPHARYNAIKRPLNEIIYWNLMKMHSACWERQPREFVNGQNYSEDSAVMNYKVYI